MKLGGYQINVAIGKLPQKVATAFPEITSQLLGAKYVPVAYLGSQIVNGINHAILAEQTVITGIDHKNIVLVVLNEKEEGFTLASIETILASGLPMGGTTIELTTDIPEKAPAEAMKAYDTVLAGFVGSKITPFAYLGRQLTKGTDYYFLVTAEMIVSPSAVVASGPSIKLLRVNDMPGAESIAFEDVLN